MLTALPPRQVRRAIAILVALIFSKFFYLASLTSYYIFYLMDHFHVSARWRRSACSSSSAPSAAGTFFGGPIGDRFGRKTVIWGSILGVAAVHAGAALCRICAATVG